MQIIPPSIRHLKISPMQKLFVTIGICGIFTYKALRN